MNNKQSLYASITGYEPHAVFSSKKDDYYFDLKNKEEKIKHLKEYAENVLNIFDLSGEEIEEVFSTIEKEKNGTNDHHYAFEELDSK